MNTYLDTSAIIFAWRRGIPAKGITRSHSVAGFFSTLTGIGLATPGRERLVISPADASTAIREAFAGVTWRDLSPDEMIDAAELAVGENIQGPKIHDWMHIRAAELVDAGKIVTSNIKHFAGRTKRRISTASEHFPAQAPA